MIFIKMEHAGLTNGQVLNGREYTENKGKGLSFTADIAVISECRNPALFMERCKQIGDDFLKSPREFLTYLGEICHLGFR